MKLVKGDSNSSDFGLIGRGIEVSGDILFADQLHVYGKVTGKLTSESGTLVIGESGTVEAQIDVGVCVIQGAVEGDVSAKSKVEIRKSGRIRGDVRTPVLFVEEGAVFNGMIRMGQEAQGRLLEEVRADDGGGSERRAKSAY